jgi:hypothetical protein
VLSVPSDIPLTDFTSTNAVSSVGTNPGEANKLLAYPNSDFASFNVTSGDLPNDYRPFTQALEIPGGILLYALMPYTYYTVSQYSVTLSTAWAVPNFALVPFGVPTQETLAPVGFVFASEQSLAIALSNIGGLLLRSNGVPINS